MMNYPLVSIGIPTHNRADGFLKHAIRSALAQTYPNIEIIISDNCSSDTTPDLVRSFTDPRLTYCRHEVNIGPANNFNFCLQQAKGDYFLLLHDDDTIDPDFVETCMKHADYNTEYAIVRTGVRIIDEHGAVLAESRNRVKNLPFDEFLLGWFSNQTSFYFCNTLFNTAKLKEIGGIQSEHNLLQDCVAIVKLSARGKRVDVEDIKASFRKHSGEITFAVKVKDWAEDFICLSEIIRANAPTGNDKLLTEAKRFFCALSYKRAKAVKNFKGRLSSYLTVYKMFDYAYYPPPINRILNKFR